MAFGKDQENRSRLVGDFSQKAAYASRKRTGGGGGGGNRRLYWSDNYKPSNQMDMIRFLYAEYAVQEVDDATGTAIDTMLPWVPVVEHYHGGRKKGALCSGGALRRYKGKRELCHGCDIYWEDYQIRDAEKQRTGTYPQNPKRVSMSEKNVLNVLDYGTYYKADQFNDNGTVRTNQQGVPFFEWRKLLYAGDPAAAGRELKTGRVLPWQLNFAQFQTLRGYNDFSIRESCAVCCSWGDSMNKILQTVQYCCRGCRQPVIDMATNLLSPQELDDSVKKPHQCQHCGTNSFLEEVVYCAKCASTGQVPRRATLWDVDIQVRMQPNPNDPSKSILMILNHSAPRPIDPAFIEIAKPLALLDIFKPTPPEEQRKLWNIQEPGGQAPPAPTAAPYQSPIQPPQPAVQYAMPYGAAPVPPAAAPYQPPASTFTTTTGGAGPSPYYPPAGQQPPVPGSMPMVPGPGHHAQQQQLPYPGHAAAAPIYPPPGWTPPGQS